MDTSTITPPADAGPLSEALDDDCCGLPRLINVATVAERLGLSARTVLRRVNAGEIPHYRLGEAIRFDPVEIKAWLEDHHIVVVVRPGAGGQNGDRP